MGVLDQHPALHQPFGDLPAGEALRGHVHPRPQPAPPHRPHRARGGQRPQPAVQVLPELRGAPLELAGAQHRDDLQGHRAGQRVPAERGAVLAGPEDAQHRAGRHHRGDRQHPAAQRLAEQVHVRDDALVLQRERPAGAPQTRLDLVGDEQHPAPRGDLPHPGQVAGRRHQHARLALDRLQQHRHRVVVDRRLQGRQVPVRHDLEAGGVGAVVGARLGVGGEADDGGGAAVEVAARHDDPGAAVRDALDLVAPFAGGLDRRLHRLGAGVHRQHRLHAAQVGQLGAERGEAVVVERPRGERETVQLGLGRRDQPAVAVAEVERRVAGEQVQVAAALHVRHPRALGGRHDDRQRVIGVRAVRVRGRDQLGGHPGGRSGGPSGRRRVDRHGCSVRRTAGASGG